MGYRHDMNFVQMAHKADHVVGPAARYFAVVAGGSVADQRLAVPALEQARVVEDCDALVVPHTLDLLRLAQLVIVLLVSILLERLVAVLLH